MPIAMPSMPAPALALALLGAFGLAIAPVVHSAPTIEAIESTCAKTIQPDSCKHVLLANMAAGSPEVNSVPLMSLQVAAKLAKMANGFANARLTTNPHPAKCLQNCIDDLHRVAKAFEGLPVGAVKPGDEAGVLSFSSEFSPTCGDDCPKPIPERTEDERATRDKFVGVMKAIGVMQDLFLTKTW
ncbi:unnamed protein product [Triticum turgidum subsp. durum]|uniref:Pectinesterase inhibitor domain-containing protein n=2 Tax=Triticum turgidum subsp. durum TaxID=4567 RepID=A0A9R0R924_TRITD|nr:unnamed protein product [Triticum turgidum subsp. durum]